MYEPKKIMILLTFLLLIPFAIAVWTPPSDIELRNTYSVFNSKNITSKQFFWTNGTEIVATPDTWVNASGDSMTGDLNMTNHSIWDVDVLQVHNITGKSPVYINSELISTTNINASNFYGSFFGDINGQNGTIFGVTIENGRITNLTVVNSAYFDTDVLVNGSLYPEYNDTHSLGNASLMWKNLFVANITSPTITDLEVRANQETFTVEVINGTGTIISNTSYDFMITQITVTPQNLLFNSYEFSMTTYPAGDMIDRDLIYHPGVWNILKSHSLNSQIQANITNAAIDENFTVTIKYINNGILI